MTRKVPLSILLLSIAAFLIPLIGGQVPNDVQTLEPGYVQTVRSLFRGTELATLQHALLALLVTGAFSYLVFKRKIVQVPHPTISIPLGIFFLLLLLSVSYSEYRWISETAFAEWVVYGFAALAAVAGLGRKRGPVAVMGALSAGTGIVALMGILEYAAARADNPSWRIFGTWQNPNALAGILVIGLLVSLGLVCASGTRAMAVLPGISVSLAGVALFLTGSKGGVLAGGAGVFVFLALLVLWRKWISLPRALAPLAIAAAMLIGIQVSNHGAAAGLRVANMGNTQEQSAGFRTELWKGTIALAKDSSFLVGRGIATYAYYSAKPGTNTRTELAHETWLQLLVEGGILAPMALLLALLAWLLHALRSARTLPPEQNMLRAGVVSAVLATAGHGLIDSNLYFFGIGLAFFLLLGLGIQLSADAGAPEFVAPPVRFSAIAMAVLCSAQLLFAGYVSKLQANLRWTIVSRQIDDARSLAQTLRSIAPFDGETWYRSAFIASSPEQSLEWFNHAAQEAPSPKYLRMLARIQQDQGDLAGASKSLQEALKYDPNNLSALLQLARLEDLMKLDSEAVETAQRLIAVEGTPYFQVRSLPQIVPTETYEARFFLADKESDMEERNRLTREGIEGLLNFARVTLPFARTMDEGGAGVSIGISLQEAEEKVALGSSRAKRLAKTYREAGDAAGAVWADTAAAEFDNALAGAK